MNLSKNADLLVAASGPAERLGFRHDRRVATRRRAIGVLLAIFVIAAGRAALVVHLPSLFRLPGVQTFGGTVEVALVNERGDRVWLVGAELHGDRLAEPLALQGTPLLYAGDTLFVFDRPFEYGRAAAIYALDLARSGDPRMGVPVALDWIDQLYEVVGAVADGQRAAFLLKSEWSSPVVVVALERNAQNPAALALRFEATISDVEMMRLDGPERLYGVVQGGLGAMTLKEWELRTAVLSERPDRLITLPTGMSVLGDMLPDASRGRFHFLASATGDYWNITHYFAAADAGGGTLAPMLSGPLDSADYWTFGGEVDGKLLLSDGYDSLGHVDPATGATATIFSSSDSNCVRVSSHQGFLVVLRADGVGGGPLVLPSLTSPTLVAEIEAYLASTPGAALVELTGMLTPVAATPDHLLLVRWAGYYCADAGARLLVVGRRGADAGRIVGQLPIDGDEVMGGGLRGSRLVLLAKTTDWNGGGITSCAIHAIDITNPASPSIARTHVLPDIGPSGGGIIVTNADRWTSLVNAASLWAFDLDAEDPTIPVAGSPFAVGVPAGQEWRTAAIMPDASVRALSVTPSGSPVRTLQLHTYPSLASLAAPQASVVLESSLEGSFGAGIDALLPIGDVSLFARYGYTSYILPRSPVGSPPDDIWRFATPDVGAIVTRAGSFLLSYRGTSQLFRLAGADESNVEYLFELPFAAAWSGPFTLGLESAGRITATFAMPLGQEGVISFDSSAMQPAVIAHEILFSDFPSLFFDTNQDLAVNVGDILFLTSGGAPRYPPRPGADLRR